MRAKSTWFVAHGGWGSGPTGKKRARVGATVMGTGLGGWAVTIMIKSGNSISCISQSVFRWCWISEHLCFLVPSQSLVFGVSKRLIELPWDNIGVIERYDRKYLVYISIIYSCCSTVGLKARVIEYRAAEEGPVFFLVFFLIHYSRAGYTYGEAEGPVH